MTRTFDMSRDMDAAQRRRMENVQSNQATDDWRNESRRRADLINKTFAAIYRELYRGDAESAAMEAASRVADTLGVDLYDVQGSTAFDEAYQQDGTPDDVESFI